MIGLLRGLLFRKDTQELLVDVQGVGYRVSIPLSTYYKLGELGDPVTLRIHTHVREEALALYGFLSDLEQTLFERLISVSGVGPKLALSVLSGIETDELLAALGSGDLVRLTRIPGVGKKTAERLILELKDKLKVLAPSAPSPSADSTGQTLREDVVSALANLGYPRPEAERMAEKARRAHPEASFEALLRETLRLFSGTEPR